MVQEGRVCYEQSSVSWIEHHHHDHTEAWLLTAARPTPSYSHCLSFLVVACEAVALC